MSRFESFVMLAGMRTGSNLLEERLNAIEGLRCHGEVFNPAFLGYPGQETLLGIDATGREADPAALLDAMREAPGLNGFRLFDGHDSRVLAKVLADRSCAKIVLTRDPLDSYLSLRIARETGQWKLTGHAGLKSARVRFDADEYATHLSRRAAYLSQIDRALQISGQTAFRLDYADLNDAEVIAGLAAFLGQAIEGPLPTSRLKPQNPVAAVEKVTNPEEMLTEVARLAASSSLGEPPRAMALGDALSRIVAVDGAPLAYLPLGSGPDEAVGRWLRGFGALKRRMTPAELRDWQAPQPGHTAFAVVRHPVARAYSAFERRILGRGGRAYAGIRDRLVRFHDLELPEEGAPEDERRAFKAFLRFLGHNLAGRTGIRIDGDWAPQGSQLRRQAEHLFPAQVLREDRLPRDLPRIAREAGLDAPDFVAEDTSRLDAIHDSEIETLTRAAYAGDYLEFGFGAYRAG